VRQYLISQLQKRSVKTQGHQLGEDCHYHSIFTRRELVTSHPHWPNTSHRNHLHQCSPQKPSLFVHPSACHLQGIQSTILQNRATASMSRFNRRPLTGIVAGERWSHTRLSPYMMWMRSPYQKKPQLSVVPLLPMTTLYFIFSIRLLNFLAN
jgi:hypothetical protein